MIGERVIGKSSEPTSSDPSTTAAAATGTNVGTAVANAMLNNYNQVTPDGSLNYDITGNYVWHDDYTNTDYNIPTFTATQTYSPQQTAINDQYSAAKLNLAGMANTQSSRLSNWLSGDLNLADAPAAGDVNTLRNAPKAQTSFADAGKQQSTFGNVPGSVFSFGDAGDITRSYGPQDDFSSDRQRVEQSLMARMNPQLAGERQAVEQRLADQGIRYGSQAYASAMDDYNRQANDARYGAISQAGSEQQRMMDMAAQRAGFQNAAQQQAYSQAQGRGEFYNAAQAQEYAQAQGRGQFANEAQKNQFSQAALRGEYYNAGAAAQLAQATSALNAQNAARDSYMNEQYANRNQPINEINSLLSSSQVSTPTFVTTPTNQIATTDVAGLINNKFSQDMSLYQQTSTNSNALIGGVLGLAGSGAKAAALSDVRAKEDIVPMGTVFAENVDRGGRAELPIYEYAYKGDSKGERHVGPMAQDVEKIDKRAVTTKGGMKHIDPRRVMGNILRAA